MATRDSFPGLFPARNFKPTPSGAVKALVSLHAVERTTYNPALKLRDPISIAIRIMSISTENFWTTRDGISKFLLC